MNAEAPVLSLKRINTTAESSYHEESNIRHDIPLQLNLPNGTTKIISVKIGETVQEIKRRLMVEHGIPYSESKLFLDGKHMLDPLSLNDFPSIVETNKACITVEVLPSAVINLPDM